MKKIDKRKITSIVYKKLNGVLPKKSIYDAITVINNSLIESIIEDKAISIYNFGTLSPYLFHGHEGMNIATGHVQSVKPFRTVKFRAHSHFFALIEQRKNKFTKLP